MPAKIEYSVLKLDGGMMTAAAVVVHPTGVEVLRAVKSTRPNDVPGDNAAAIGGWIAAEFSRASLTRNRVVLCVPRSDVVLKQLSLPGPEEVTEGELANIVKLQMSRQVAMGFDGAAVDYAVLGEQASEGVNARDVLAGAMPADRMDWYRGIASAAGLKLVRIGLHSAGVAALLTDLSRSENGPIMGIAIGASTLDFVIDVDGKMVFARSTDLPKPSRDEDPVTFAEKLAVEAKRTWMSFRNTRNTPDLAAVAVVGDEESQGELARRIAEVLECRRETVIAPDGIWLPDTMSDAVRADVASLAGVLFDDIADRPNLDFANPKRAPDLSRQRRQIVLVSILGSIVIGGLGFISAKTALGNLAERRAELVAAEATLRKKADEASAVNARAQHIKQWSGGRPDWLKHFAESVLVLPTGQCILDEFGGVLSAKPAYVLKKGTSYPNGTWSPGASVDITIQGSQRDGDGVAQYREILLARGIYGVQSSGPDMPERFALDLATQKLAPKMESKEKTGKDSTGEKQIPAPKPSTDDAEGGAP